MTLLSQRQNLKIKERKLVPLSYGTSWNKTMRKRSVLKTIAGNYKRKATNAAISATHELLFGEKPKRGRPPKKK